MTEQRGIRFTVCFWQQVIWDDGRRPSVLGLDQAIYAPQEALLIIN